VELLRLVFEVIVLGPQGVVGHVLREPNRSLFGDAAEPEPVNQDQDRVHRIAILLMSPGTVDGSEASGA
jgi:hypothetical protein